MLALKPPQKNVPGLFLSFPYCFQYCWPTLVFLSSQMLCSNLPSHGVSCVSVSLCLLSYKDTGHTGSGAHPTPIGLCLNYICNHPISK